MSVTDETGAVDCGLGLAEVLDGGLIAGKPVSLCFEHPALTAASTQTRASTVNERRIGFSLSTRDRRSGPSTVSSNHQKRAQIGLLGA